ncbi:MAG: biopolymer transporter ExbD [Bacteroidetes bacterium]|nr:biopolymer transporter ExbD [Bacteroidota bacterium]
MAEVNTDSGGGGGKHHKKGRKKGGGNPRVDMTPMVDLAFLLLTFFVLTSQLNKSKTMEIRMPKDVKDTNTTKINNKLAITLLLDGNKDHKVYYYEGMLNDQTVLNEVNLDPKKGGLREYVAGRNAAIIAETKALRTKYKAGGMADSTFRKEKFKIEETHVKAKDAPFFIVKWGGEAHYGDVVNVIDELKICDVEHQFALTPITRVELEALSKKTGTHYKELDTPDPTAAAAGAPH